MKELPLTRGYVALVDEDVYEWASKYKWNALTSSKRRTVYAKRNAPDGRGGQKTVRLHREILGATDPKVEVDHIDGDGLNNQRNNLRLTDHSGNMKNVGRTRRNTSGFKGVSWSKKRKAWRSAICLNRKTTVLGHFDSPEEAHAAYVAAAERLHREFARTE